MARENPYTQSTDNQPSEAETNRKSSREQRTEPVPTDDDLVASNSATAALAHIRGVLSHLSPEEQDQLAESIHDRDEHVYVIDISHAPVEKGDLVGKIASALVAKSKELPHYRQARAKQKADAEAAKTRSWGEQARRDIAKRTEG